MFFININEINVLNKKNKLLKILTKYEIFLENSTYVNLLHILIKSSLSHLNLTHN